MSRTIPAVKYELGVTRLFGEVDLGTSGLVSGWSNPETLHVWNDGLDATLLLTMKTPSSECRITFEGEPFVGGDCTRQDITLYVNGFRLGFWRLTENDTQILTAPLQPEQCFDHRGKAVLNCTWHLPLSRRPSDFKPGADARILGFCFRSFSISEA